MTSAAPEKLSDAEIEGALSGSSWSRVGDEIQRTFHFDDFIQAMAFVQKVATSAEADQHHPDILIRYNKVTLTLSTHDAGGLTKKDFDLAHTVDSFI